MKAGIDASNLRAGGGVTHLVQLLRAANPAEAGFGAVVVWAGGRTLSLLPDREWLHKRRVRTLDGGLISRMIWQSRKLGKAALAEGCDVLFVPGGSSASGFAPVVTMSQNLLPFEWRELRRFGMSRIAAKLVALRFVQGRSFRMAEGVIFLTRYARDAVLRVVGPTRGSIALIPHGIDDVFFLPSHGERSDRDFTAEAPCRVVYVSIVDNYKHQWVVAEAVARLRRAGRAVALELIGPPGHAIGRLRKALTRLDPNGEFVRYMGPVPHVDLPGVYASADVGVFASSCENLPNILLEMMAAGMPIACSDRGPMPEVLLDAGVYFDPESADSLTSALERILASQELRHHLRQAARSLARHYSWPQCASQTFRFLAAVASNPLKD